MSAPGGEQRVFRPYTVGNACQSNAFSAENGRAPAAIQKVAFWSGDNGRCLWRGKV